MIAYNHKHTITHYKYISTYISETHTNIFISAFNHIYSTIGLL